jgi:hypothetical protein
MPPSKAVFFLCRHGASDLIDEVPVDEVFNGQTIWKGTVEVFILSNHPKASVVMLGRTKLARMAAPVIFDCSP